jgi:hypothetical protein
MIFVHHSVKNGLGEYYSTKFNSFLFLKTEGYETKNFIEWSVFDGITGGSYMLILSAKKELT